MGSVLFFFWLLLSLFVVARLFFCLLCLALCFGACLLLLLFGSSASVLVLFSCCCFSVGLLLSFLLLPWRLGCEIFMLRCLRLLLLLAFCCGFRRPSLDILLVCFAAFGRKSFAEGCRFSSGIFSGALVSSASGHFVLLPLLVQLLRLFGLPVPSHAWGPLSVLSAVGISRGDALSKFHAVNIWCLGCFSFVACAAPGFMSRWCVSGLLAPTALYLVGSAHLVSGRLVASICCLCWCAFSRLCVSVVRNLLCRGRLVAFLHRKF